MTPSLAFLLCIGMIALRATVIAWPWYAVLWPLWACILIAVVKEWLGQREAVKQRKKQR